VKIEKAYQKVLSPQRVK